MRWDILLGDDAGQTTNDGRFELDEPYAQEVASAFQGLGVHGESRSGVM